MAEDKVTMRPMVTRVIPGLHQIKGKVIPGGATLGNITANLEKAEGIMKTHDKVLDTIRKEAYKVDAKGRFELDEAGKLIPINETSIKEADAKYNEYLDSPCEVTMLKLNNKVLQMIKDITPDILNMLTPIRQGEFTGE